MKDEIKQNGQVILSSDDGIKLQRGNRRKNIED